MVLQQPKKEKIFESMPPDISPQSMNAIDDPRHVFLVIDVCSLRVEDLLKGEERGI